MTQPTPPGWYPDPSGQPGLRWWDGNQWTENFAPQQPQQQQPAQPQVSRPDQVQKQVQQQAGMATNVQGGGSPLTEPILVVNQKKKLIELTNEYAVYNQHGQQIGAVVEVGQSTVKKAVRFLSSLDQFMTHRLEVRDSYGQPLLVLTRPAKIVKSSVIVSRPDGFEVGRLVQRNVFGKIRFGLESGGHEVGSLNAENWRAWDFAILDHTGTEVARIKKTWEGLLTTMFTTADNYVVQIHRPLQDPLHSLVVASALTVDTALKQDSRGFN
jgi:uncharacterized protein YxjI